MNSRIDLANRPVQNLQERNVGASLRAGFPAVYTLVITSRGARLLLFQGAPVLGLGFLTVLGENIQQLRLPVRHRLRCAHRFTLIIPRLGGTGARPRELPCALTDRWRVHRFGRGAPVRRRSVMPARDLETVSLLKRPRMMSALVLPLGLLSVLLLGSRPLPEQVKPISYLLEDASRLDAELPAIPFRAWLENVVGEDARID